MTMEADLKPITEPRRESDDADYGGPALGPPPRGAGAPPSRLPLVLASAALAAALTGPYWSPPLYKALHLRPPAADWQARQEVETGRLALSVAELDRRIGDLGAQVAKANEGGGAARAMLAATEAELRVLALLDLRSTLRRPVPFDVELKVVRALNGKLDGLESLFAAIEPFAASGIMVESQLRREFASVADAIGQGDPRPAPLKWLANVTGWSPVALEPGVLRPVQATERVQSLLSDDNLAGAVAELETLDLTASGPARAWVGEARARIAANQLVERIANTVVTAASNLGPRT